jgi:hypothetical protein
MVENAFQIIEEAVLVRRIDAFVILRTRLPDALVPTVLATRSSPAAADGRAVRQCERELPPVADSAGLVRSMRVTGRRRIISRSRCSLSPPCERPWRMRRSARGATRPTGKLARVIPLATIFTGIRVRPAVDDR